MIDCRHLDIYMTLVEIRLQLPLSTSCGEAADVVCAELSKQGHRVSKQQAPFDFDHVFCVLHLEEDFIIDLTAYQFGLDRYPLVCFGRRQVLLDRFDRPFFWHPQAGEARG